MGLGCQMGLNHNVGVKCLEKCCGLLFYVFIYGKKLEDFKQDCKNLRMTTCVQLDGPSPPVSNTTHALVHRGTENRTSIYGISENNSSSFSQISFSDCVVMSYINNSQPNFFLHTFPVFP